MTCETLGGCCGDAALGHWYALKRWCELRFGLGLGPDCVNQTTGGGHSSTSKHYIGDAFDASTNYRALSHLLVPYAVGDGRIIDELFCSDEGVAYQNGEPSTFHDNCCHAHVGWRAGATLPVERDEENMGAYAGESIKPGETKTYGLLEPGAVAPNGRHYVDPGLVHLPFDAFDAGAAPNPGKMRWAVVDKGGAWKDGNGAEGPIETGGIEILTHPGYYQLTVENHEPAGGREIGCPVFSWGYEDQPAAMMEVQPAHGEAPAAALTGAAVITDPALPPETPADEPEPTAAAEPPGSP